WLLALLLLVAAGLAAVFAWHGIQNQLNATASVAVPQVVGMREAQAVGVLSSHGLKAEVLRRPNPARVGFVYEQSEAPGNHIAKDSTVNILVSSGKPKTTIPAVIGKSSTDAVAELVAAHLKANVHQIQSDKPTGTVTGQDPHAGVKVPQGTAVRINVSQGPKPVGVPSVIGASYDSANSQLQGAGFLVARRDVDSSQPAGTVVSQSPTAGSFVPAKSTITLDVSKGPKTSTVPDVTSTDQATAISILKNSGFNVSVVKETTTDSNSDGVVLSQSPLGSTQAKPGTTVTINVGKYVAPTTTTAPPPPPPTTTAPTTTTTPTTPGIP
ncbi:MAG: eukaryotic-like serine/threonine-protein kinase, partial [Gaiellaceae bacterium]|nr:eukaryotic-like serine/threonine-protein kinase [Gaiellaceae bacterium]